MGAYGSPELYPYNWKTVKCQHCGLEYNDSMAACPNCGTKKGRSGKSKGKAPMLMMLFCILVVVALVGGAIFMNPEIVDFTKRVIDSNVSGETSNSNISKQNNKQKQQNKTDNQITQAVEPTKTPIEEYKTQEEFLKVTEPLPITCSSNLPDGTMISQCIVKGVKYAKLSSGIELSMDIEKTYDYFGTQPCFVGLYIKDKRAM
ncbi:MAG: zinc ribbon domain-containing protein [Lachnospiraceae bacterium]|nr:zinc ribbon domain-containing protein [Lachnospiraceae bacterium]